MPFALRSGPNRPVERQALARNPVIVLVESMYICSSYGHAVIETCLGLSLGTEVATVQCVRIAGARTVNRGSGGCRCLRRRGGGRGHGRPCLCWRKGGCAGRGTGGRRLRDRTAKRAVEHKRQKAVEGLGDQRQGKQDASQGKASFHCSILDVAAQILPPAVGELPKDAPAAQQIQRAPVQHLHPMNCRR